MRSIWILFLLISTTACAQKQLKKKNFSQKRIFLGVKKKVAIIDFVDESSYLKYDLQKISTGYLRSELEKNPEFIVDSFSGKMFGNSKAIYASGGDNLLELATRARSMGINFIIFGRIIDVNLHQKKIEQGIIHETQMFTEVQLEVKIFDVIARKEIFSKKIKGRVHDDRYKLFVQKEEQDLAEKNLHDGIKEAVRNMISLITHFTSKINWVGRVAKILTSKIYLNAGHNSGIEIGDILRVMTKGYKIYDPETGLLIGNAKGELKGTIEIIDHFGSDGSVAVLHSGGTVHEGDLVQLYDSNKDSL